MIRSTIRKNILSKNWADFRANLAIAISKRKLSRRQIQKLYSLLRETKDGQFYADNQSAYPINSNSADWNTEYMDELFAAVVNGYTNEKIVLHMCDVSNKLKWRDKRYIIKVVLTALGVIVGIVVSIVCICLAAIVERRRIKSKSKLWKFAKNAECWQFLLSIERWMD